MKTPKMFLWEKNPDILDRRLNKLRSTYNVKSEMNLTDNITTKLEKMLGQSICFTDNSLLKKVIIRKQEDRDY